MMLSSQELTLACESEPMAGVVPILFTPMQIQGFATQMPMHMRYEMPMNEASDDMTMLMNKLYFEHTA